MKEGVIDNILASINRLETDFRAETVAAGLAEAGLAADKVLIVREKGDKRYVSKDISKIEKGFSTEDLMEYLYIYTNRESIYDAIPEKSWLREMVAQMAEDEGNQYDCKGF